jgi:hypothetical protein
MDNNSLKMKSALEALSVVAVVLSLIFVGLEVNESTRATRSATAAETTAIIAEWYMSLGSDLQGSSVLRRFVADPQSLTLDEKFQAVMNLHALMLILQSSFYLEEEGTLSPQIRRSMTQAMTSEPGVQYFWEQRKPIFVNEKFIAFIEQLLADGYTHSKDFYRPTDEQ